MRWRRHQPQEEIKILGLPRLPRWSIWLWPDVEGDECPEVVSWSAEVGRHVYGVFGSTGDWQVHHTFTHADREAAIALARACAAKLEEIPDPEWVPLVEPSELKGP